MRNLPIPTPPDLDVCCWLLREAWKTRDGRKDTRLGIYTKSLRGALVSFLWQDAMTGESGVLAVVPDFLVPEVGERLIHQLSALRSKQWLIDGVKQVRKNPKRALRRIA